MKQEELFVPSVHAALTILEWLAQAGHEEATLTHLADNLQLSKSTCLRILKTLTAKEYLSYHPHTKTYSLGRALIPLGLRAQDLNDSIRRAVDYLPHVASDTGLTVVLVQRIENRLMYLSKQEARQNVRLTVTVGETFPIHCGALGKCFLAFLDAKTRKQLLSPHISNGRLPAYTKHTITSIDQLTKQLDQVREIGVAQSAGEYNEGVTAISCPIFDHNGNITLALGIFMLRPFEDLKEQSYLQAKTKLHARRMTQLLAQN
ncbi:MAG: IclR family transcriptional regulator [Sporolactobacillus sp.]